jgi:hypothetical protein
MTLLVMLKRCIAMLLVAWDIYACGCLLFEKILYDPLLHIECLSCSFWVLMAISCLICAWNHVFLFGIKDPFVIMNV